ncbi:TRAP transporter small permease subunit [Paraneptunicella aestuarii]|uniref:TRAP transporter small permease subunit n=1 Tax=Paraneptunicella aestuarii TaxID=2831148 RepID=UPI001E48BA65|nr:TRAP transporter small permease subunit [Paraneptunicella aestuarii]UAA38983.1 TRAP transporter small permease subunit [Paraneptunicella aestuarii]
MLTVSRFLNRLLDALGTFCALIFLLMIINVFYDVVMRYFFNDVSIAMQELEWHLFAAMFMFGIAYTLKEDGHVRVDILYANFSPKLKAIVNLIGMLLFAMPITLFLVYFGYEYTFDAYQMGEGSADPGGLPNRWIVRSIIPLSAVFLLISIFNVVLTQVIELTGRAKEEVL